MGSRKSKGPPPLPDDRKSKIRSFQEEAGRVIAESGGLTVACQVKLMALGRKLGLSEEDVLEAIGSLEASPKAWIDTSGEQARRDFFRKYVQDRLADRQGGLLLPGEEKGFVDDGTQPPFALSKAAARRIVRQVARQKRLSLMSSRDARLHLVRVVRDVMGDSPLLDQDARRRIRQEGDKYGLTPGHLGLIIRRQEKENRRQYMANLVAPTLAVLAVLAVGVLFVFLLFPVRPAPERPPPEEPLVKQPAGGDWWDMALVVAIGKARVILPKLKPILKRIESPDSEARASAYEALIARLTGRADEESVGPADETPTDAEEEEWLVTVLDAVPPSEASDDEPWWPATEDESSSRASESERPSTVLEERLPAAVLRDVLVGCHALEPSEASARRLRTTLLGLIPDSESGLPEDVSAYHVAFWSVETAVAALEHPKLDTARAESLAQAIAARLNVDVDRRLMPEEQAEHCLGALSTHLYRVLIAAAPSQPDRVQEHLQELRERAKRHLDSDTLDSLNVDLLLAVLPAAPDTWSEYRSSIRRTVISENWESLRKLVDLYERSHNRELQSYLTGLFGVRFDLDPGLSSVADVAAAVRKMIDVASSTRAERLHRCAAQMLADGRTADQNAETLLQATVNLTKISTLGCALAQKEAGYATFDRLLEELESGQTPSAVDAADDAPGSRAAPRRPPAWVAASIRKLEDSSPQAMGARLSSLQQLAERADRIRDLTPEQGATVAHYLLVAKHPAEYEEMRHDLRRIGRWKSVRLGLADELANARDGVSPLQQERILEVVSEVLGWEVDPAENASWPETQRNLGRMLLRDVYDFLNPAGQPGRDEEADARIRDLYGVQAKLLGVPPDEYLAATTPGEVLRLMIVHHGQKLARGRLRPEDAKSLDRVPHELAVVDYLGENDLARTVLLQRIWARLLAIAAVEQNPGKSGQVEKLLRELSQSDRDATDVLSQLRDGERTVAQLWMVFVESTSLEPN